MSWPEARDGGSLETKLRKEIQERKAEIKFVGELTKIEYKPGDLLVLMTDKAISDTMAQRLKEYLRETLGQDAKVLVLDSGMKVGLIGGVDASPRV